MNRLLKIIPCFFLIFMFSFVRSFAVSVIRTRHFEVLHEGVGKHYAEIAARSADRSFTGIVEALGHEPGDVISLIITRDNEQFKTLTKGTLPDWSSAVALPGNRIIISPLAGQKVALERIIAHEVVHCIINDAVQEMFVPRWFHEGCAQTLSGRWGIRDRMYMVWKVSRGNLLSFADIQEIFSAASIDATLAYDQSMYAVKLLMSIHGKSVLRKIIGSMKEGIDFPTAFYHATGLWPSEFEDEYIRRLKKAYGRRTLLTLVPGTWTTILMLAVLAYIVKKYRNRRLLRQWEEMEKPGNIIDFNTFPPDE